MKKIILISLVFSFFSIVFAQNNQQNNVDLKKMFQERVNEIKKRNTTNLQSKKEILTTLPSNAKVVKKSASVQNSPIFTNNKKVVNKSRSIIKSSNLNLLKGYILFQASLLASIVVVYRRKKQSFKKELKKELKQNISLLREEKLFNHTNNELVDVRKSLTNKKIKLQQGSSAITQLAKKLSIAKGEVHLAIKLNVIAGK